MKYYKLERKMIKNLEQNYISVIIVVNDEKKDIIEKINKINDVLKKLLIQIWYF